MLASARPLRRAAINQLSRDIPTESFGARSAQFSRPVNMRPHRKSDPRASDVRGRLNRPVAGASGLTGIPQGLLRLVQSLRISFGYRTMRAYTAVIERGHDTNLYVGYVPGFPGAHSQGATLDELQANLQEVIAMLIDDGEPKLETEFVGTQTVVVG